MVYFKQDCLPSYVFQIINNFGQVGGVSTISNRKSIGIGDRKKVYPKRPRQLWGFYDINNIVKNSINKWQWQINFGHYIYLAALNPLSNKIGVTNLTYSVPTLKAKFAMIRQLLEENLYKLIVLFWFLQPPLKEEVEKFMKISVPTFIQRIAEHIYPIWLRKDDLLVTWPSSSKM